MMALACLNAQSDWHTIGQPFFIASNLKWPCKHYSAVCISSASPVLRTDLGAL